MNLTWLDHTPYFICEVNNFINPNQTVELRVQTTRNLQDQMHAERVWLYMQNQSLLLIPYFYELRNALPRGKVLKMLTERALTLNDAVRLEQYDQLMEEPASTFNEHITLQCIHIQGNSVYIRFVCDHDPEFCVFEKTLSIPFDSPSIRADMKDHYESLMRDEALKAEKNRTPESAAANEELNAPAVEDYRRASWV